MEHKAENMLDKLLCGRADGAAVALRACPDEHYDKVLERFGPDAPARLAFCEPCRVEHPHSAYLRKPAVVQGQPTVQTTLYAPDGRLTEERAEDGSVYERFVKKPADFETLRGHLRDVELHPGKALHSLDNVSYMARLGLTPVRDMETRWAGPEMTSWALMTQDESAASCLRKLERQFHRRCEEAVRLGCRAGLLTDMSAEPLPQTYMLHAGRHIEWMRHTGLAPWVDVSRPEAMLLAALDAAHAGARVALDNPALYEDGFAPPETMRWMFDIPTAALLKNGLEQSSCSPIARCACSILLLDCQDAKNDDIIDAVSIAQQMIR